MRWGWAPLVGGSVAIAATVIVGGEILFVALGHAQETAVSRLLFVARALVTSALMAVWAGFYVLSARRRIEAVRDRLRREARKLEERAWRAEQGAGMGALSRILAHEIRSPLNGLSLHCELLRRRVAGQEHETQVLPLIEVMEAEAGRLARVVDDYLAYTKAKEIHVEPHAIDLAAFARETIAAQSDTLAAAGIEASVEVEPGTPAARADTDKLRQAFDQVLRNCVDALPHGGRIRIGVRRDDSSVALVVADDGPGFRDAHAIFRPFYTTKVDGSGLGLAIVRDVVRAHGGEVRARNLTPSGGAEVMLRLPAEALA